jgi:hypothetical protein
MPVVDHSPAEAGVTPAEAVPEFLAGSSSTGGVKSANGSITVTALMAVISALLVPSRMLFSTGATDDSSVFAYIGWAMHHGLMPYRDLWDHKGPLLYYLQFAGMWLWSTSTFGIGLLELIALSIALFLLYRVITSFVSTFVGRVVAVFGVTFVAHFSLGGNMCESWALLPLATAHYASWRWSQRLSRNWCAPLLGASFACIFWIRPNMVTYPALAVLILLYATKKAHGFGSAMKQFALASTSAVALSALIVVPLYRWGVFHDFIEAYFGYNAAYSNALSLSGRLLHTSQLLALLFPTAIAILGTAGWALWITESRKRGEVAGGLPSVYLQTLLWSLPFEIAAASLSGRDYPHYLLPLFPTFVVLAAWFLDALQNKTKAMPALATALMIGLCPFMLTTYSSDFSRSTEPPHSEYLTVVHFIQRATTARDRITVIGETESGYISFLAQRLPASRFVYQLPLIDANNPVAGEQRKQFMCDIAQNRPAVIVSGNPTMGILCASKLECTLRNMQAPETDYGYQNMLLPNLLQDVIASQYRAVSDPRFGPFRVLVRNDVAIPAQW